jgi:hypothetical protein
LLPVRESDGLGWSPPWLLVIACPGCFLFALLNVSALVDVDGDVVVVWWWFPPRDFLVFLVCVGRWIGDGGVVLFFFSAVLCCRVWRLSLVFFSIFWCDCCPSWRRCCVLFDDRLVYFLKKKLFSFLCFDPMASLCVILVDLTVSRLLSCCRLCLCFGIFWWS